MRPLAWLRLRPPGESTIESIGPVGEEARAAVPRHGEPPPAGPTRRGLIVGAAAGALGVAGVLQAIEAVARSADALAQAPQPGLRPDDPAVRQTIAALADTVVPGPAGGADPAPGAVEAGAVEEVYAPLYGLAETFPALHADAQLTTRRLVGPTANFDLELPYPDRERVLLDRIEPTGEGGDNPLYVSYAAVAIVVWFAYYGTAQSDLGVRYIDFPPHSDGYAPHHTHGVRFRGMTEDGNPG